MTKSLSFIITTHLNPGGLKQTLQSLASQSEQNFEIIIVSNFHETQASELALAYRAQYFFTGVKGVNRARNLGVRCANTRFIYFLDDDCYLPDPHYSKRLMQIFAATNGEAAFIGGLYTSVDQPGPASAAYISIQNNWLLGGRIDQDGRHAYLVGGNCGGQKKLFERFPFDNSFVYGGSETEMFLRASHFGISCRLVPDLKVYHDCRVNFWKLSKKAFRQAQGKREISRKLLFFTPPYYFREKETPTFYMGWYRIVFHFAYLFSRTSVFSGIKFCFFNLIRKCELIRRSLLEKLIAALEITAK
jgi:glycosyltransferase involved in cell wall biosynthesis